jgi:ligand-binding sensor domain-containing protein
MDKTKQENITGIKTSLTEIAKPQGEIIIDTSRQTKLDFSNIAGNFDKVYSNVHNGFQDKAGNIWFSTTGAGAIRFDGKFFNHITIIDKSNNNSITPLLEDKQGNIWFASANGIYRYDGKIFTNIPTASANNTVQTSTPNTSAKRTSISVISAMQDKKGNIWFGTETNGVYHYDGQNLTNFLSQKNITNSDRLRLNTITSIMEDKKGNIWFASWNNEGLCCYDGKSVKNYTPKNGLGDDMIYSIYEDKVGNIWIGSRNHGVWRYDGKSFASISRLTDLKDEAIYSIKQDNNRIFWFATQSKGVWKYDGNDFTNFTTKDGLHNNSVFCIVPEKNGNLWFGSRGMGLSMYDGKIVTDLTKN